MQGPLAGGATIAGRIALTETELRVPSTGFGGAGGLPGLQHVNEPSDVRATRDRAGLIADAARAGVTGPAFGLDVTLSAPNRLFLRGRGLDAELGGELRLLGSTAAVQPVGAFNLIRGRLEILGKRLELSEALLQMEGALVPFLRIVASIDNDGITSGVLIEGPATDPKVTFTSSPQLPEEEVLAQLLFGQTLQDLSVLQALQLANAVATLAGKGGEGVVGRLRDVFGLDNLDVKTDAAGGASVTAGKYITESIYTEVTVDQAGQSQINLNLDVTDSLILRGRASSDGTAGLGVVLEKDY
jgi:translocation and assembly module TamB